MKVVVYILLFAAVAIATRIDIQYWRPLADSEQVWSICITLAAAACLILATNRQKHKSPAEEKPEPRFQGMSPYDGEWLSEQARWPPVSVCRMQARYKADPVEVRRAMLPPVMLGMAMVAMAPALAATDLRAP